MNIPLDNNLYNRVKREADEIYDKPSAYKSGWIVKRYKDLGGKYSGTKTNEGLTRWMKERWTDIGGLDYPVYRPTKRINKNTPLTPNEIDPENLDKQIKLKQILKGDRNLPSFEAKGESKDLKAVDVPYSNKIWKVSNPLTAQKNLNTYLGKGSVLFLSTNKDKKYFVYDNEGKKVHFGNINYEDFTKHTSLKRRKLYLARALNIRGDWKNNKYSPNNLAISILWT